MNEDPQGLDPPRSEFKDALFRVLYFWIWIAAACALIKFFFG